MDLEVAKMRNLLRSNLYRLFKSTIFWIVLVCCALAGILVGVYSMQGLNPLADEYLVQETSRSLWVYANVGALLLAYLASVVCVSLDTTEYHDGGIRNKVCTGAKRSAVYLSSLLIQILAALCMLGAYYLPVVPALDLWTSFSAELGSFTPTQTIITSILTIVCFTCIIHFVTSVVTGRGSMIIAPILLITCICVSLGITVALSEPPSYPQTDGMYIAGESVEDMSVVTEDEIPNPAYISGNVRAVYEFWQHALPTGAAITQLTVPEAPDMYWVYLGAECIIFLMAGTLVFRRRNIS